MAEKAVELVRTGNADLLMKGSLHTDELLAEVVKRETGIRTRRRISHVFVMDVPGHPHTLLITDAAVNIASSTMSCWSSSKPFHRSLRSISPTISPRSER
jgi:phosphotransacetylase